MLNCPKCGFLQPEDRYCASCGIDMKTYRPKPPPAHIRLAKSWVFQLSLIVVAVIAVTGYLRGKQEHLLRDRMSEMESSSAVRFVKSFTQSKNTRDKNLNVENSDNRRQQEGLDSAAVPNAQVNEFASQGGDTGISASGSASGSPSAGNIDSKSPAAAVAAAAEMVSDPSKVQPTQLRVIFVEIRRAAMAEVMADSRNVASLGTVSTGILNELENRLKAAKQTGAITILDSATDLPLKLNQPVQVFKGARDEVAGLNFGLNMQIVPTSIDEAGAHLQMDLVRNMRESSAAAATEQNWSEQYIVPKGGAAFLLGTLPHRALDEDEARLLGSIPTFRVHNSQAFISGNSEFALFIEAR